jgi:protein gp37
MAENSKIAWTTHTFNPWWGCVKVSQGCKDCYAETWAKRTGYDVWGVDAPRRFFGDKHWKEPLKWNADAEKVGERAQVFCASMADVFEIHKNTEINRQMSNARSRLFLDLIPQTPWIDWLILTKRPENIFSLGTDAAGRIFDLYLDYPNVWLGTSVEDQENADKRIPLLTQTAGRIRFLSVEPMLERINIFEYIYGPPSVKWWVIVGGESGPGCRPFDWNWARDIRDQCAQAGVPFFMKQGGGWPNKREHMNDLPVDLRIREFPQTKLIEIQPEPIQSELFK